MMAAPSEQKQERQQEHEPLLSSNHRRLDDASRRRRRRRGRQYVRPSAAASEPVRAAASTTAESTTSLANQVVDLAHGLGSSAFWQTLEWLKVAGGATLSTTGAVVAPPLRLTAHLAWSSLVQYLDSSPLKHIWRVVSASIQHFIDVVAHSTSGQALRKQAHQVGVDVLDLTSQATVQQALIDGMALFVKIAEALDTPESHEGLDQAKLCTIRLVEVLSSSKTRVLIHDVHQFVLALVKLGADTNTTTALAKMTATLCRALAKKDQPSDTGNRQRRRHERHALNAVTRQAHVQPSTTHDHYPNTTERAIMSSLGNHIVDDSNDSISTLEEEEDDDEANEQMRGSRKEGGSVENSGESENESNDDNNLAGQTLLDEQIAKRARALEQKRMLRTTISTSTPKTQQNITSQQSMLRYEMEDLDQMSIEGEEETFVANDAKAIQQRQTKSPKRARTLQYGTEEDESVGGDDLDNNNYTTTSTTNSTTMQQEEEGDDNAVKRFYKVLDQELLRLQRQERQDTASNDEDFIVNRARTTTRTTGDGIQKRIRTVKQKNKTPLSRRRRGEPIKFSATARDGDDNNRALFLKQFPPRRPKNVVWVILSIAFLLFVVTWGALGCFGLYVLVIGNLNHRGGFSSLFPFLVSRETKDSRHQPKDAKQEIVIRIVKEIIHVDKNFNDDDGERQERSTASTISGMAEAASVDLEIVDKDKLVDCIADTVDFV